MKKAVHCGPLPAILQRTPNGKQFDAMLTYSQALKAVRLWVLRNSFSPTWLPIQKYRQSLGYVVAILVQLLLIFLDGTFKYYFSQFPVPSIFTVGGAGLVA